MIDLLRKMMGNVFMDQAGADGGAGAGGAPAGDGAGQGGEKTLMESAAAGELDETGGEAGAGEASQGTEGGTPEQRAIQASEKDIRRPKSVPAKFWNAEKGEVNFEAWAKSTGELEARMKDVGLPPKTAEEYTFDAPKEFKEAGLDLDPAMTKEFRDAALEAGLTQKQYEFVMGKYFASIGGMVEAAEGFGREGCRSALMGFYKTEEAMGDALKAAFNTYSAYADEEEMKAINRIGNNPFFVRILAKINREMTEDRQIDTGGAVSDESIEELMAKGSPYWDASHPQHKRVVDKVTAYHQRKARDSQRKRAA
jgi:hypothetical protein